MSHREQRDFCVRVRGRFGAHFQGKDALDIGSRSINGNNRWLFHGCRYLGLDLSPGRNVDVVGHAADLPAGSAFDVVISTEALEHDARLGETLARLPGLVRPGGLLVVTCATDPRAEHGTAACKPGDSPATNGYYRNVPPEALAALGPAFAGWAVEAWRDRGDLYFWGLKGG